MGVRIIGTGSYLPENIVFNKEIELTSSYDPIKKGRSLDKWARHYHGGIMRHVVKSDEGASDLALKASQEAINSACLKPRDIDLIVMSTFTGDHRLPQTAGQVQAEINPDAKFIQIDAACSGFIDGTLVACSLLEVFKYKNCLLIGVDVPSFLCDPKDYLARSVFGDGAGAVVLINSSDVLIDPMPQKFDLWLWFS